MLKLTPSVPASTENVWFRAPQAAGFLEVGLSEAAAGTLQLYAAGGFRFGVFFSFEWLATLEAYQP